MFGDSLNDRELKQYIRELNLGETLFQSGEVGKTMFLILQGQIGLYDSTPEKEELLIAKVSWGQVVGEQAIVGEPPYSRVFSAKALVRTRVLEFDIKGMRTIEKKIPDFTLRILQITAKWLDRTNQIIHVLKSTEEVERVVRCLCFISNQAFGTNQSTTPSGTAIAVDYIHYITGIAEVRIEGYLSHLVNHKIMTETAEGYRINNPKKFVEELLSVRYELEEEGPKLRIAA